MADTALELGEVDPPKWRVLVHGTTYGPYTLGQMQSFVRERRIGPESRVSGAATDEFLAAHEHDALRSLFESGGRHGDDADNEPANYLIVTRLNGTGKMQIIGALNRLGKFAEVMPGVWTLRSRARQARVRERLQATIGPGDQVMISNATTGRLAWLNLGPESDVHIRRVWDAPLEETA
ncbi:GYF domain-containing protein [Henriciella mobilis]|uniref:DUF4339 domain-containing protein n=1 Tax=Henriciella mobilis TaxID=2305467 RepID=A0A399RA67_9PROT|nr:GYF domain-containing protein [Henriciella mobilis]RIJ14953.1 DUF4339 domain-containing protein [Henriciella mobilis]RIJ21908.1 DUF4339 domain-containing protein [Henriciella mobilis]RIJ26592.1 DUF4339 domain-containing protein [Henriciella mobilis]